MSVFIEVIEWMDPSGEEMIYRLPQEGSADFKLLHILLIGDNESLEGDFLYRRGTKPRFVCVMVRGLQMGI